MSSRFRSIRRRPAPILLLLVLVLSLAPIASVHADGDETALDRYIAKPDPAYAWRLQASLEGEGYSAFVLELTSQSWRRPEEVDRTEWKHWLTIIRPDDLRYRQGLLYIGGGRNGDPAPSRVSDRSLRLALETGSVVADLGMVPNQPLHFADSRHHPRHEDDLIAYGRVKYIVTGDEEWLVRLAMVKSGVRAMDAVQEFLASDAGGEVEIESFVVAGGSKRGWTTWLVGVVDERVVAIMPLVIDALNTEAITRHHYAAYGFFSPSLGDYVRHGLYPHVLGTDAFRRILTIEDPYLYRHRPRLRIPKYVINASGDQYFLPDNSQFYFLDMPDEKYLRYVPNAKHNLAGSDARDSMIAFYRSILDRKPRPQFSWVMRDDESIEVTVEDRPREVNLWQAHNPEARDFRLDVIGPAWTSTALAPQAAGRYRAVVEEPDAGFVAYFVELVYDSGGSYPFKFTTDVSVRPDRKPHRLEEHEGPWLGARR